MIISEKQVYDLMDCAHGLLNRMITHKESPFCIEEVEMILNEIREQQSTELKDVN